MQSSSSLFPSKIRLQLLRSRSARGCGLAPSTLIARPSPLGAFLRNQHHYFSTTGPQSQLLNVPLKQPQSSSPTDARSSRHTTIHHYPTTLPHTYCRTTMSFGTSAASRLAGKTVLITGASSGIGRATAFEFANASNGDIKLILTARREATLVSIKEEIEKAYPKSKVFPIALDVSKLPAIDAFVDNLPEEAKDIDVLINNAGMVHGVDQVGSIAQSDIDIMFQTNVFGLIALTQKLLPLFKEKGKGDIVNIGSIAGREPYPGGAIYCATKAAVKSFTETLRKELIATRIRVIEVDPGQVETEFSVVRFRGDKGKADAVYKGVEPLIAEDIAEVIVFAVSRRENVVIADTLVFPSHQASALIMHRKL
ncbi:hypothetical protein V1525DRAFT_393094 [Lipomyces kononenkoae]|uniref:Uncharacterized protein n=1 Tax=Lipomyces kononenkoae TaxID=34357 RepID=A0ACC3TBW9_LIPKO